MWLRQWQTELKHKWKLASEPYTGGTLFSDALNPLLVEGKDKKKILPANPKKGANRPAPYPWCHQFRGQSYGGSFCSDYNSQGFRT